jgi:hypothetical protein
MRTVDAALTAALSAGNPIPYLKAYIGYTNGTVKNSHTNVYKYILTGTSLEFWIPYDSNFVSDQESIWLERGVTVAGTTYSITTGRFFIAEEEYLPGGFARYKGFIFPHKYYSAAGDLTYEQVIDAFSSNWSKTAVYKDDTEAWLAYQFLPDGQVIITNSAMRFLNHLQQKRLIQCCDNGSEEVRFYSADVLGSSVATFTLKDEFALFTTKTRRRQYVWRDEAQTVNYDGTATDPLHNLGYLESTDSPPARNTQTFQARAILRPDLRIQDGDVVTLSFDGGTKTATIFAQVTEVYDAQNPKAGLPAWHMILEANPIYHATEGGAMPSTIERVSNYTPLNTSTFDDLLDAQDNNLQAAMETIDEHHPGGYTREVLGAARTYYVRHNVGDCTISNASPAVVTKAGHGLLDDDPIVFRTSGTLPTGLTAGTVYYVNYVGVNTFQVAATPDGASINTSSAGSGTHSVATGSDSNLGLTTGRAGALLNISKALSLASALDTSIYNVTIQLAKSHYYENLLSLGNPSGKGTVTVLGDETTPANCIVDAGWWKASAGTTYVLNGFQLKKISTAQSAAIRCDGSAVIQIKNLDFSTGWSYHLYLPSTGELWVTGSYTISGGCAYHIVASITSIVRYLTGLTVTLSGTPAWSGAFCALSHAAVLYLVAAQVTMSGAATGVRYSATLNAVIDTNGGGATYLPGNAAGSTATGGQYA